MKEGEASNTERWMECLTLMDRRCKFMWGDLEESQIQTFRLATLAISSTEMLNVDDKRWQGWEDFLLNFGSNILWRFLFPMQRANLRNPLISVSVKHPYFVPLVLAPCTSRKHRTYHGNHTDSRFKKSQRSSKFQNPWLATWGFRELIFFFWGGGGRKLRFWRVGISLWGKKSRGFSGFFWSCGTLIHWGDKITGNEAAVEGQLSWDSRRRKTSFQGRADNAAELIWCEYTLPDTNSLHLQIGFPKRKVLSHPPFWSILQALWVLC